MKKIITLVFLFITALSLSACTTSTSELLGLTALTSEESLASLSYLSAGILDTTSNNEPNTTLLAFTPTRLSNTEETTMEIETELDEVNIYMDKLKSFIENGPDQFGTIVPENSDRVEYSEKLTITVGEEVYVLYYNIDILSQEITGIFVVGTIEYDITATNSLEDSASLGKDDDDFDEENKGNSEDPLEDDDDDLEEENKENSEDPSKDDDDLEEENKKNSEDLSENDEDDGEEDDNQDETEYKMVLIATNGLNTIKITYKLETEENEVSQKFVVEKDIDGVQSEVEIKIEQEEDEYKIEIKEDRNEYSFKREIEDDEITYKLEYEVNGVEGEVKITVTINEFGEEVYNYQIKEDGNEKEVEKDKPDSQGFDEDDDDEEDRNEV